MTNKRRLVVGVTGASGAIYGIRFIRQALRHFDDVFVMLSAQALQVAETEMDIKPNERSYIEALNCPSEGAQLHLLSRKDYYSPPASGSFLHDGMVIVPCSMGTAGRIANGISDDLLTRSADVCLKERRKLVLVVREMPWNLIQLRNLTQLTEAGAIVMPASPSFYSNPKSIDDLADTVVARILQQLGVNHQLVPEWQFEDPLQDDENR